MPEGPGAEEEEVPERAERTSSAVIGGKRSEGGSKGRGRGPVGAGVLRAKK